MLPCTRPKPAGWPWFIVAGVCLLISGGMAVGAPYPGNARLVAMQPADLAAGVPANSPVTVSFADVGDPGFYQGVQFALHGGEGPVAADLYYNPAQQQIMLKPKQPLRPGQTYTAQISYQARPGQPPQSQVWRFQAAGAAPPTTPAPVAQAAVEPAFEPMGGNPAGLSIIGASMANGSVPDGQSPLTVSFSEPIDINCLRQAPVQVLIGKTPIGIDYQLNKAMTTLTLVPRQPLHPGSEASVAITSQLTGRSGARLARNTLIPFRVAGGSPVGLSGAAQPTGAFPAYGQPTAGRAAVPTANPMAGGYGAGTDADAEFGNPPTFAAPAADPIPIREPVPLPANPQQAYTPAPGVRPAPAPAGVTPMATQMRGGAAPLKVVAVSPSMSEKVTNPSQPVVLTFDREVKPETVNEFNFRLEDDFGPVPARIQYLPRRRQAVLTPIGVLETGKRYRIVATPGIIDLQGQRLPQPWTSAFIMQSPVPGPARPSFPAPAPARPAAASTDADPEFGDEGDSASFGEDAADLGSLESDGLANAVAGPAAPRRRTTPATRGTASVGPRREKLETVRVVGVWPSNGATEVPRSGAIRMRFNVQMDPNTINPINIALFGRESRVEGQVRYEPERREAVFIPAEPLYPETAYKVVMSDKIRSASGERLLQKYRWAFTTNRERLNHIGRLAAPRAAKSAFSIPLVDRRNAPRKASPNGQRAQALSPATASNANTPGNGDSFPILRSNHWSFKSIGQLNRIGILPTTPFISTNRVTRYEMAMAINTALNNLNNLRNSPQPPRLALKDLVHLEHLVIEFRPELRSYNIDVSGFESFLSQQGVNLAELETRVQKMNQQRQG